MRVRYLGCEAALATLAALKRRTRFLAAANRLGWFVLLALLTSTPAAAHECTIELLPKIPVTMVGLRPMIWTKIDGRKARLLIDTGAFWSMLSPAAEAEYNLPERFHTTSLDLQGVNGATATEIAIAYTFTFLDRNFHGVEFLVGGNDYSSGAVGLLGGNLLRIADAEFDFADGEMRFFETQHCGKRPLAYWAVNQPVGMVNLRPSSSRQPDLIGHAMVNGKKISVLFDTGSARSILTMAAARRLGITPASPGVKPGGSIFGIGRNVSKVWIAPISVFEIGGEKIENPDVLFGDIHLSDAGMILGADFFLSHRVSVAYGRNKLYFTYNGGPVFNLGQPYLIRKAGAALVQGGGPVPTPTPASANALAREGMAYASERRYAAALADLGRACALEPKNPEFLFERGEIYRADGQPAKAFGDFGAAIALRPDSYRAHLARATLLLEWRHAPPEAKLEAHTDADAVDRLAPAESDLRLPLASVYARMGRYSTAIRELDRWISYHDEDVMLPDAWNMRCWFRAEADVHLHKALRDCDRALERLPKSAGFLDSGGLVNLRLGRLEHSLEDYDAALKIDPRIATSLYGRGLAELRLGEKAKGRADLAAARALDPPVTAWFTHRGLTP